MNKAVKFGRRITRLSGLAMATTLLGACSVMPPADFPRESSIDVDRYMGSWYVIAHIPPKQVNDSWNNIETYERVSDTRIQTTYTYRKGGFEGERKRMEPVGFVQEESAGAVWGMRFIWPIKLEYTISYVDAAYQTTIVARSKRDWVWIMARTPQIDQARYQDLVKRVAALGYDVNTLRVVPQQPASQRPSAAQEQALAE